MAKRSRTADLPSGDEVLARFSDPTQAWFTSAFPEPTPAQIGAWSAIASGANALVVAPTGSGKTLSAFLWAIDQLVRAPAPETPRERCRILYISPLKALGVDVERNLRSPLAGISRESERMGRDPLDIRVGVRSGDTSAADRRRFNTAPPDIFITTPESLFLILTSSARSSLAGVQTVIIDEIHAIAGSKRGAHLALSLERLDALLPTPAQRIGLSATVRPIEAIASFLGGSRPVTVVNPPSEKTVEINVVVPVEDMSELGAPQQEFEGSAAADPRRNSIWPHVEEQIIDLVSQHQTSIVFANSRRLAERLTGRLNEMWHERSLDSQDAESAPRADIARAHHGSVSKEQRAIIEDDLKSGRLKAVVATSSLELGIDMGAVDLVIQVESPPSVASGMQRIGRAGHQVGGISKGVVFPKFRGDLVQSALVAERMQAGKIEAVSIPRNPLDVLAQHLVSMTAMDTWDVGAALELIQRAAPFTSLPPAAFDAVLDMLSGRYPSDEFAELRPRLVWDRVNGTLTGRPGAQRLAVTSGGTIPDRGLFSVFLVGEKGSRVGELDEEMVYESRVGDVFSLGASSWRIEEITHDRVLVSPAPGQPGRLPFWHGDSLGRPVELGTALGTFVRELGTAPVKKAEQRLEQAGLDANARTNLLAYLTEQKEATGHVPDDRTIVIERVRDELGDWRIIVHTPFGAKIHAPWALAVGARLREQFGVDAAVMHADDGIVLRLPDVEGDDQIRAIIASLVIEPDEVEALVTDQAGGSALFASRFREAAARALLLPRRNPGRRSPLWQQRQKSAQLLSVASNYGSFPIVIETMREVLQDVYDVPGLVWLMRAITAREISIVDVETPTPSPFAQSLLFGYIAAFMYEGDSPLAERRAAALTLDTALLAELLGQADLRELLDPESIEAVESELQWLTPERHARSAEGMADLLRILGPLTAAELEARGGQASWIEELVTARRAIKVRVGGRDVIAAIEDSARLRDALGTALPPGVPDAFLEPVSDPIGDLLSRWARTHGPFQLQEPAEVFGFGIAVVAQTLERLSTKLVKGEFRPGGSGIEWCDAQVLRLIRRRSVAALRKEAEPVPPAALGTFLPAWQHVAASSSTPELKGTEGVLLAIEQLAGAAIPASAWESLILPARVANYQPRMLDELTLAGEVTWVGAGSLSGGDGWLAMAPIDTAAALLPQVEYDADPLEQELLDAVSAGGGWFFHELLERLRAQTPDLTSTQLTDALWNLVWAGRITGDSWNPIRAQLAGTSRRTKVAAPRRRARYSAQVRIPTPAQVAGRWSRAIPREPDSTLRSAALAQTFLDRYGVVTRGAVSAEGPRGGFSAMYRVLAAMEESGRCQRGYIVEGLGAAQFATSGAVDRLRMLARTPTPANSVVLMAATDPANPYGAALPWPTRAESTHRPGRKAGAMVVLVDGELALYVERGGRSLLTWSQDPDVLAAAGSALADAVRSGQLGKLTVERGDGESLLTKGSPISAALAGAGFIATPRGLRIRA